MSEIKTKELTLYNKALSQLSVICLSLSFLHIYIEDVHNTFTTFNINLLMKITILLHVYRMLTNCHILSLLL